MTTGLGPASIPQDRIVRLFRHKGWEVYGCGPMRAEIDKSGKKFRWRVWHVVGPQQVGSGRLGTRKAATQAAWRVLAESSGINLEREGS